MTDYLRIYMDDQLALGVLWRETARRAAGQNSGTELGEALERVAGAIAEDVVTFERLMERLGRLKPNGHLRGYSPLSRFDELEFLTMGIEGKKQLWGTLRDLAGLGERFPDVDFDALIARAAQQKAELEPFRVEAGRAALGSAAAAPA